MSMHKRVKAQLNSRTSSMAVLRTLETAKTGPHEESSTPDSTYLDESQEASLVTTRMPTESELRKNYYGK